MDGKAIEKAKNIYFIGIGGIGMSALARMMHADDKQVSGSDREMTEVTQGLVELGIEVSEGHGSEGITKDTDLIIYSRSVPEDNPERARGRELDIQELSYAEALGKLSEHRYTIAVAGAHGKTTTTAMIHHVVHEPLNSTLVVGSLLADTKSNFEAGDSEYFVIEACEYKRSFLELYPNILVITNIEADHLDYYKDLEDIKTAFNDLVRKVPSDGFVVCDINEENVRDVLAGVKAGVINASSYKDVDIELPFPAAHNIENASKALAVAEIFDIPREDALTRLKNFKGTWRRQEHKGVMNSGALLFDDYAHHPTEIRGTLSAFKELYPDKRIIVAFQPHLHSRTEHFFDEFVESLRIADKIITAPVYEARTENESEFTSRRLASELGKIHNDVTNYDSFDAVSDDLKKNTSAQDVVILMGAGDLYKIGDNLVQ